ncbi:hypothetical protein JW933_09325, partial [candidate division FCPU426 bacterium]|nr:hypothetical protein [candidate division FCPU426 bacterium]
SNLGGVAITAGKVRDREQVMATAENRLGDKQPLFVVQPHPGDFCVSGTARTRAGADLGRGGGTCPGTG